MSDWPYSQITTHRDDGDARFTSYYEHADGLKNIAGLYSERMQELEDAVWSVLTERWVPEAVGTQLDEMGEIVGEPRLGRTDAEYRPAIELRISLNQSGGEPERIIEFLRRIAGADAVIYKEIWPAKIEIYVRGDVDEPQAHRVRELVPAGVGTIYITESGGELPFGIKEEGALDPTDRDGFGELGLDDLELSDGDILELSDGSTLGINDINDPLLPTEGGIIAELFEV